MALDWFPLVLIYIVTNSTSKILQKVALKDQDINPTAFSAFFLFLVGVLTIPLLFFEEIVFPTSMKVWLVVIFDGVLYTVCMILYYYALKSTEVSQVEAIATTRTIWFMVLGIVFFDETLRLSTLMGVGFIFFGLLVIYWNRTKVKSFTKPHVYTIIYAFLISSSYALDKYALSYFSVAFYQVVIYIIPAVFTLIFLPRTVQHLGYLLKSSKSTYITLASCFVQMISTLALYSAYKSGGALSIVGPLSQTSTVVTIVIGITLLKEKWNLKRKILGIALSLLGVFIIKLI